jgi:AcrR family transcriptional regulator
MGRKSIAKIRKREILEHFFLLVKEEGLEGASTVKLARRMKIHSSLLMHYFHTKEELIHALVEYMMELYEENYRPLIEAIPDSRDRFAYILDLLFSLDWQELAEGAVYYSCFALLFRYPLIRERFAQNYQHFHQSLVYELNLAQAAGLIPPQEVSDTAHVLIAMAEGLNQYERVHQDKSSFFRQGEILKHMAMNFLLAGGLGSKMPSEEGESS